MKRIGILGGLGPPSTVKYYEGLVRATAERLGPNHFPRIILNSLNGADIAALRMKGDAAAEGDFYAKEALRLEKAGADFIIIASNTSHKNASFIKKQISIPLLHLADVTADSIHQSPHRKIGLLGTRPTMEEDFYVSRLTAKGLEIIIPDEADRIFMNEAIYHSLVQGIVTQEINERFSAIIKTLKSKGAQAIILGCTELTLLDLSTIDIALFDTVKIHIKAAVDYALSE